MLARFGPIVAAVAVAVTFAPESTDAHSYMSVPKPSFPEGFYQPMSPYASIADSKFPGAASIPSYKGGEKIAAAIETSGAKTLRQFVMANMNITQTTVKATKECGTSLADGTPQELPDEVVWNWAHNGPCEIWCDNTRLFYNIDCMGNKVGNPVKVDKTKCAGASFIQGMQVGTHVPNWEVYMDCVPLIGGKSKDAATTLKSDAPGDGAAGSSGSADAPAPAPSADSGDDEYDDDAPATTPATTTKAPTPAATPKASSPASAPSPSATTKPSCAKRRRN